MSLGVGVGGGNSQATPHPLPAWLSSFLFHVSRVLLQPDITLPTLYVRKPRPKVTQLIESDGDTN